MESLRCSIELREDTDKSSPRITGTLLVYNERAGDRPEVFVTDSLSWASEGVVLRRQHNRSEPILRFLPEVREGAVVIDTALPDTVAGRDAAVEIRGGLLKGLSVEFVPSQERNRGGVREIVSAELVGAGLVDSPSYTNSRVDVRSKSKRRRVWL